MMPNAIAIPDMETNVGVLSPEEHRKNTPAIFKGEPISWNNEVRGHFNKVEIFRERGVASMKGIVNNTLLALLVIAVIFTIAAFVIIGSNYSLGTNLILVAVGFVSVTFALYMQRRRFI